MAPGLRSASKRLDQLLLKTNAADAHLLSRVRSRDMIVGLLWHGKAKEAHF